MTLRGLKMGLVTVLMTAVWASVSAQQSCTNTIVGMYPCLSYITGNTTTPSSSCCSQLSTVVTNRPQCLCTLLSSGGSSFGFTLNRTLALALPSVCKIQTPPVSRCNAVVSPAASPMGTPVSPGTPSNPTVPTANAPPTKSTPSISGTPPSNASTTTTTTPDGSKTTGSTSSASSSTAKPLSLVFSILFIGSFASSALTGF